MLVPMKEILDKAVEKNCAVPALWGGDLITSEAALMQAEEMKVPLIFLVHPAGCKMMGSPVTYFRYLSDMCRSVSVPVTMILDHGRSYKQACEFMSYGVPSLMFDGSTLPFEENVAATKEIVKMAHNAGISVEGEIGHVGSMAESKTEGDGGSSIYTQPDEAVAFAEQTGVDALAISIGTMHGIYDFSPKLQIDLLKKIRASVGKLPLVMHGGSGLPDDQFRLAVKNGINKVNYVTYMQNAACSKIKDAVIEKIDVGKGKFSLNGAIEVAEASIREEAKHLFELYDTVLLSSKD